MIDETLVQTYFYIKGINFLIGVALFIVMIIIAVIAISIKWYFFKKELKKRRKKYNKK